jgi:hypothetical protein
MKIGWGWKIGMLYSGFVVLIVGLVVGSLKQQFDLVSQDYYGEELAYQKTIDAGRNQASLSEPFGIHANAESIFVELPAELAGRVEEAKLHFYCPTNSEWDRTFRVLPNGTHRTIAISRSSIKNARYTIKLTCKAGGKTYYQETELQLHS